MNWLVPAVWCVPAVAAVLMLATTIWLKARRQVNTMHWRLVLAQSVVVCISIWTLLSGRRDEELLFVTIVWTLLAFLVSVAMLGLFFGKRPAK